MFMYKFVFLIIMRVLLINPWGAEQVPPPAIGYLQSVLKANDVDVTATDLNYGSDDYDLVAVTFHSFSVRHAKNIRNHYKGRLICGGHHPSAMAEQMLSIGYDQVVIGEGENAMLSIVNGDTSSIVKNDYKHYKGVNDYPIPDYTGLKYDGSMGLPIISSRGCASRCNFCASSDFWGHKYTMRSAENVITEIEYIKSLGLKTWIFYDDNFTANKKRTYEICSYLTGEIKWQCTSRAEVLDEDICRELYRAGCRRMYLGIESFSQGALDRCNKNTTVEKMVKGIVNAEKAGIATVCLFIVGLPGDTIEDVLTTKTIRQSIKISEWGKNIAWILPGTDLYRKAKEKGFDDNTFLTEVPYYTYEQSMVTLQNWYSLL